MAIPISQYVNINSSVGAASGAIIRNLYGRMFTGSTYLDVDSFEEFTSAADVGTAFGFSSEEYYRAVFYFGWVSKNNLQAQAIQFARWNSDAASAPMVISSPLTATFNAASWASITNGGFIITIGGVVLDLSGTLVFTGVTTGAEVAAILQTGIRTGTGSVFTSATVTYVGAAPNPGYVFTAGATGAATISISAPISGTNITGITLPTTTNGGLGWLPEQVLNPDGTVSVQGAIWDPGSSAQTLTECLTASAAQSNNFGTFGFMNNLNLDISQVTEIATWNSSLSPNNQYMYTLPVSYANTTSWQEALADFGGCSITIQSPPFSGTGLTASSSATLSNVSIIGSNVPLVGMPISGTGIPTGTTISVVVLVSSNPNVYTLTLSANATASATVDLTFSRLEFPEMVPMMIAAATNYSGFNTVQNYEFQTFALTPSVFEQSFANAYNDLNINYYGEVQNAGQKVSFYQQGVLQGLITNPLNQNTYVNEIWLKDAMAVAILNLLLGLNQVPANAQGQSQILSTMQGVINTALNNGTISVGKSLTTLQQTFITAQTGDSVAWHQVQNNGYWVNVVIVPSGSSPVIYTAVYTLIYSQDDVIRLVTGSNILI
jgi:hypothetical protein